MKTIDNHKIYQAIKKAMEELGLELTIGGDTPDGGIYNTFKAEDDTQVDIIIKN